MLKLDKIMDEATEEQDVYKLIRANAEMNKLTGFEPSKK